ncbi:unnamed protein product [Medioppia subpectinata]|uniref:NADP-dependent oxidoreductase domain-containing protein n=1 Tax=Medioppia subpectinata TaxID=1979941 RepID=A0A7R9Q1P6_9ACAR|nr:unnamed protein product [Medioppia subpectinata]CAG2109461.1 unnamed protein product [Medioppia subpectinata]
MIGLGTLTITNETVIKQVIDDGLAVGYRHIDTAYFYMNERFVGEKLREIFSRPRGSGPDGIGLQRRDIWVTSKLWCTYHSRAKVAEGLKLTLKRLNIQYLDMYLIHFPFGFEEGGEDIPLTPDGLTRDSNVSVVETWKGMEDVYRAGLVKSIGVSNFNVNQLCRLMRQCQIKPVVNQLEIHPYLAEVELVRFCQRMGIRVEAYSPLAKANQTLLNEPILVKIGQRFNKTPAQVIMRWLIQRNIVVIPGTTKKHRLVENFSLFDFKLTQDDMKQIYSLDRNWRKTDFPPARFNSEYPYNRMGF